MTTVFLCGPVTNGGTLPYEREIANRAEFRRIRAKFSEIKNTVVLDGTTLPKQETWDDYMKLTIPMVCEATYVVLLPGWENSKGAMAELFVAHTLNIPIVFSDHLPI